MSVYYNKRNIEALTKAEETLDKIRASMKIADVANQDHSERLLMNYEETMEMLAMCANDKSDAYYEAASIRFLAQSVLFILKEFEKELALARKEKPSKADFYWE